jgi:hypothetical protein
MAFPIIPKKRSGATGSPTSLTVGELAVNTATGELFLGGDTSVLLLNPPTAAGTTATERTGDGTTTAFTFTGYSSTDDGAYLVSVGGIDQPPSKYSVSSTAGGTITFVEAPTAGELISIRAIVAGSGGGGSGDATSLQSQPISAAAPVAGQLLEFTGEEWEPKYTTEFGSPYAPGSSSYTLARLGGNTECSPGSVAIGDNARALGLNESVAIGIFAIANSSQSIAIGPYAQATDSGSIAIGENTTALSEGIALGKSANASSEGIALGKNAVSTGGLSIAALSLTGSPTDPSTVISYMAITLNGTLYYMPLYQ